jgi:hypothetical protein
VASSIQLFTTNLQSFEEDYSTIIQDSTLPNDFKQEMAETYLDQLQDFFKIIVVSFSLMLLLVFIFDTLIKTQQYKSLIKHRTKGIKSYFVSVWQVFRNTFPLFFIFGLVSVLMMSLFGMGYMVILVLLILSLIYTYFISFLRMATLNNTSFKKSWKTFFLYVKKFFYFLPITLLYNFIGLIVLFLLLLFNSAFDIAFWNVILMLLQLFVLMCLYVFSRRYIFLTTNLISRNEEHRK